MDDLTAGIEQVPLARFSKGRQTRCQCRWQRSGMDEHLLEARDAIGVQLPIVDRPIRGR